MGSSCTCIKKANENELETFGFSSAKLAMIIKIQKTWKGYITRKKMRAWRSGKRNMRDLNKGTRQVSNQGFNGNVKNYGINFGNGGG
jgi:hypothetical protein